MTKQEMLDFLDNYILPGIPEHERPRLLTVMSKIVAPSFKQDLLDRASKLTNDHEA